MNIIKNKFIVVEGIEGSGKTTAIYFIKKILRKFKITNVLSIREPGSTEIAEKIRNLIKKNFKTEVLTEYSELLLIYSARIQLMEKLVRPALKRGMWIIGDRSYLSSYAYQGVHSFVSKKIVSILQSLFFKRFHPDLIFFLDISVNTSFNRIKERKFLDRIERKDFDFFIKVREEYLKIAKRSKNVVIINAEQTKKEVFQEIKNILYIWMKK